MDVQLVLAKDVTKIVRALVMKRHDIISSEMH